MTQRKIIVSLAISADGYIARPDGGVDWLDRPRTAGDYGMRDFYNSIDTILLGRKTYEIALGFGKKGSAFSKKTKNYVFTHTPPATTDFPVEFVNEPIKEFATRLKAQAGKDIWMMGGGDLIGSFLDAGELDEFIMHVIPTFIGEGIPLIGPRHLNLPLKLIKASNYEDGVVCLHYSVIKKTGRQEGSKQKAVGRTQ